MIFCRAGTTAPFRRLPDFGKLLFAKSLVNVDDQDECPFRQLTFLLGNLVHVGLELLTQLRQRLIAFPCRQRHVGHERGKNGLRLGPFM
jgi:hypothetical protein